MSSNFAYIKSIAWITPEKEYSNTDFFKDFPEAASNANLLKVGVEKRFVVDKNTTASDLAFEAGIKLFQDNNIQPESIDFLIFCSLEFDYITPATSCVLQDRLGLRESVGTFDFNHGCSGYTYALSMAKGLIESGQVKNVLILTTSTLTKNLHPKDKSLRFVFGDAAAATLVDSRTDNWGIGAFEFGSRGKDTDKLIIKDGLGRNPIDEESSKEIIDEYGNIHSRETLYMDGIGVFLFSMNVVPKMVNALLEKNKISLEQVDHFVFHQANAFLNESLRKKLNIPEEKFMIYMAEVGNTVASTIPIALSEGIRAGRFAPGDKILLAGFGTGLSWSGTIVQL